MGFSSTTKNVSNYAEHLRNLMREPRRATGILHTSQASKPLGKPSYVEAEQPAQAAQALAGTITAESADQIPATEPTHQQAALLAKNAA